MEIIIYVASPQLSQDNARPDATPNHRINHNNPLNNEQSQQSNVPLSPSHLSEYDLGANRHMIARPRLPRHPLPHASPRDTSIVSYYQINSFRIWRR